VYQVKPGETLRQLIARVGGFTSQAYLYGAEFTRESTREAQQQRLDQYNRQLEQDLERSATPRAISTAEESTVQRDRVESERRLLEKMRQLRASGRVVLETKPNSQSVNDVPDLVLEDGDRLFIPFRPATVNVIGSVYNSNSFIFKPSQTVSDYLKLSGGATRAGDTKKIFIVRASGETISRQNHSSLVGENFNHIRLMPGDTILVPYKIDSGAGMRGIKDWSQVIGQFGIAAAAAGVLF
jgi:protein involved in polysaccharide export with SLBB domain